MVLAVGRRKNNCEIGLESSYAQKRLCSRGKELPGSCLIGGRAVFSPLPLLSCVCCGGAIVNRDSTEKKARKLQSVAGRK
jgi:hypothetical protein